MTKMNDGDLSFEQWQSQAAVTAADPEVAARAQLLAAIKWYRYEIGVLTLSARRLGREVDTDSVADRQGIIDTLVSCLNGKETK